MIFVNDGTQNPAASFTVSATDGSLTTASVTVNVAVTNEFVLPASIDLGGVSETINSLTQSGATLSGTGTLTDANGATFTGGTENGSGTTLVNGPATFFDANNETFTLDGSTLELHGSAHTGAFTGDTLHLNNGARLIIDAGVTFTDAGTAFNISSSAGSGSVNVAGTYVKTGSVTTDISDAFANSGTIDAESGTLDFTGNVTNKGALKVEGGGTLMLAGTVNGTGAVSVGDNGTVEFGSSACGRPDRHLQRRVGHDQDRRSREFRRDHHRFQCDERRDRSGRVGSRPSRHLLRRERRADGHDGTVPPSAFQRAELRFHGYDGAGTGTLSFARCLHGHDAADSTPRCSPSA